ncbi:odorant receptor 30a-like [Pieris rapae]|uniref:odorant receptor 30a-like n=1 Tax=Pieris rapae TaxID=64459 RepID=UPI001E280713|nr:odorant receptor 30a-like [Pieris rapae]
MFKKLQQFGIRYCDFQTMISNVSILLRLLLITIDKRNTKRIPFISFVVTILISVGYFYTYLISAVWYVFWRCQETGDKISALIVFSLGVASEISAFKLLFMYIYSDTIRNIVEGYLNLDAKTRTETRLAKSLESKLKIIKKRAIMYWCIIISNGVLYAFKPLLLPGRHLMEDNFDLFGLDPILESPNYEIAFTSCVLGIFYTCYLASSISAFLIVIAGYTESQLIVLSEEIKNLWDDAKEQINRNNDSTSYTEDDIKRLNNIINNRLKNIIITHITNIDLMNDVKSVFSGSILIEFLLVITSLIAELLGGLENTYLEMPFALAQLTMDCITGQKLIDACDVFNRAIYDSKWENFDNKNAKMVLLMLQNSQKPLYLSAGGMTNLSFVCLMSILRMIYSGYTTLRSTIN